MLDWFLKPSHIKGGIICTVCYIEGITPPMLEKIVSAKYVIISDKLVWNLHLPNKVNFELSFGKSEYVFHKMNKENLTSYHTLADFDEIDYMTVMGDSKYFDIIYALLNAYYPNIKTDRTKLENKTAIIKVFTCFM